MGLLLRILLNALSLGIADYLIAGIRINGLFTLILASLLLGVVNAVVRPILLIFTFPITVVTLGLFLLVVNAAMLGLTAWLLPGFTISGFIPALLGWVIITVLGWFWDRLLAKRLP